MKSAGTAAKQATAASSISSAYGSAAKKMEPANATPYIKPLNDALTTSLRSTGRAYTALASAARADSATRYDRASKRVTSRERRVRAAVDSFAALGFQVS
jgi:hypothetical protein